MKYTELQEFEIQILKKIISIKLQKIRKSNLFTTDSG